MAEVSRRTHTGFRSETKANLQSATKIVSICHSSNIIYRFKMQFTNQFVYLELFKFSELYVFYRYPNIFKFHIDDRNMSCVFFFTLFFVNFYFFFS